MEEKIFLNDLEKIQLLELNNKLLARQNEAMRAREAFIIANNLIPQLQKELEELEKKIIKNHEIENGIIENDYSISEVK